MRAIAIAIAMLLASGCGGGRGAPPSAPPRPRDGVMGDAVLGPELRLRELTVASGPLETDAARASLARMRPRVQACIDATSLRVQGSVDVRLDVSPTGQVARSGTDRVEGLDPDVVFCIVRALRGCRLPRASAASVVRVGLDFTDPRPGARASIAPGPEGSSVGDPPSDSAPTAAGSDLDDPGP